MRLDYRIWGLCAAFAVAAGQAHAATWSEVGDAGDAYATAQDTGPSGSALSAISGVISSTTDADIYKIFITDPSTFHATTLGDGGSMDSEYLWLFDANGHAVISGGNLPPGADHGEIPTGDPNGPQTAGVYYLGIAPSFAIPLSTDFMFNFPGPEPWGVPNPFGAPNSPVTSWQFTFASHSGSYTIFLDGAETAGEAVVAAPAPMTLALFGAALGGLALTRRRR